MDIIRKLGYSEKDKLIIIHADDAGLAHAENNATIHALKKGMVSSYSIMVPCPWYFEMADFALKNPEFDYGIHLTLTSEWKHYKFGPVLSASEVPSLVNKHGYFHETREAFKTSASIEEVGKELRAQIDRAFSFGLKPSHLDSHMYTLGLTKELLTLYKALGQEYNLPILLSKKLLNTFGPELVDQLDDDDLCVDHVCLGNFEDFKHQKLAVYYEHELETLNPGLNIILIHPAFDTDEMRAITKDYPSFGSSWRQIDVDFFTSDRCRSIIEENGIKLINWRDIQKVI